ncbi:enoyl-CoA hydratase-related protein [Streptomyces sp. UG1]|uniref:enoyl-CoA hydratase/isomerase family protein n=1 Tax=Streptomyces sp. UG1 TaxID=3417652 RepID=UPI003CEB9B22
MLSPIRIGPRTVANRVVSTAHGGWHDFRSPADDGSRYIAYQERRAAGGCGLIIRLGHLVTVLERAARVGGRLSLVEGASAAELGDRLTWLSAELAELEVDVRRGVEADRDVLTALPPDAFVVTTGAEPSRSLPPYGEMWSGRLLSVDDAVTTNEPLGTVLVVGKVTVVSRAPMIGGNQGRTHAYSTPTALREAGCRLEPNTSVTAMDKDMVTTLDGLSGDSSDALRRGRGRRSGAGPAGGTAAAGEGVPGRAGPGGRRRGRPTERDVRHPLGASRGVPARRGRGAGTRPAGVSGRGGRLAGGPQRQINQYTHRSHLPPAQEASMTSGVLVERDGHVLTLTLDRPEAGNAVTRAMATALGEVLAEADRDRGVRAIVLTGSGSRWFCSGVADEEDAEGSAGPALDPAHPERGVADCAAQYISTPIVAAVNGAALGAGMELVLACDLVVAADTAIFGLPQVSRGLLADAGGAFRLPAQIPPKIAMEMLLLGESVPAARARELGLINRIVPAAELLARATELARAVAANPPAAVQATKRVAAGISGGIAPAEAEAWQLSRTESQRLTGAN